jgi:uncharacterized protein (TIGR00730 family)
MTSLSICVFCGSSNGASKEHLKLALDFGGLLGRNGHSLVYGGGDRGLMGAVSNSANTAGAKVTGVMPKFLQEREGTATYGTQLVVETLHDRKMKMFNLSDAFACLPGGIGTLEETIEVISWNVLSVHKKRLVLLDREFWTPLTKLFNSMSSAGLMYDSIDEAYVIADSAEEALDLLLGGSITSL